MKHQNILFCFCGPAGAGKSSICRQLLERSVGLCLSVSTTTRSPRDGEVDGDHYYFISEQEFDSRLSRGEFLEHASYGRYRYGTQQKHLQASLDGGSDVLLDIEVQGVQQLKEAFGNRVVTIFVFPPSLTELRQRLTQRGTESESEIFTRLAIAEIEFQKLRAPTFSDYILINDNLERSITTAIAVVTAERSRLSRFGCGDIDALLSYTHRE